MMGTGFHRDELVARSMTRDRSFVENATENYVECVDAAIGRWTGARHATDETVIRDAKGGIARLRCMIITVKKGRRGSIPTGFPGDYRMSGGERILPA